jgi:hypothetical protein
MDDARSLGDAVRHAGEPMAIDHSGANLRELRETVDAFMTAEMDRLRTAVPSAATLTDESREWPHAYYVRHQVEQVKRIRMTSRTDALALAAMVDEDYQAARWWSRYVAEELNHDLLFLSDLKRHGMEVGDVAAIAPFTSTVAMVAFIESRIRTIGSQAAVAYSVWVEWNSDRSSAIVADRAAARYGRRYVKGTFAHIGIDDTQDHLQTMLSVAVRLIGRGGEETEFFEMLRRITDFAAGYFRELAEACPTDSRDRAKGRRRRRTRPASIVPVGSR